MDDYSIELADWRDDDDRRAVMDIRHEVFVVEQEVPEDLETDGADPDCRHLLAISSSGKAIGTARMQPGGHVGRIAVLVAWRKRGVGARLVGGMMAEARNAGMRTVDLDSQVQAMGFYAKLGFETRGEVFMEAGIPHQNMVCDL